MRWIEKRPKGPDANVNQRGDAFEVRVRLRLPDGRTFARELTARTRTAARKLRDDVYAAYNEAALDALAGKPAESPHPAEAPEAMTLRALAEACRDEWWPAKGRSPEVAEQYYQKLRDYVFPVLGNVRALTGYDAVGQIVSLVHLGGSGVELTRLMYAYDGNGNRVVVQDALGSRTTYAYDGNDRLASDATSGTAAHAWPYAYDARGNLLASGEPGAFSAASYDAAGRLLTATFASGVATYSYDRNGNRVGVQDASGRTTMTYDPENRLRSHTRPDGLVATFLYDGDGRKRVEAEYNGRTTLVWDGEDLLQTRYANAATFVSQQVPSVVAAGSSFVATVTFANVGTAPWMAERGYFLASLGPGNNVNWGTARWPMADGAVCPVGSSYSFARTCVAPATSGTYTFQWCPIEEGVERFGLPGSPALAIQVT